MYKDTIRFKPTRLQSISLKHQYINSNKSIRTLKKAFLWGFNHGFIVLENLQTNKNNASFVFLISFFLLHQNLISWWEAKMGPNSLFVFKFIFLLLLFIVFTWVKYYSVHKIKFLNFYWNLFPLISFNLWYQLDDWAVLAFKYAVSFKCW